MNNSLAALQQALNNQDTTAYLSLLEATLKNEDVRALTQQLHFQEQVLYQLLDNNPTPSPQLLEGVIALFGYDESSDPLSHDPNYQQRYFQLFGPILGVTNEAPNNPPQQQVSPEEETPVEEEPAQEQKDGGELYLILAFVFLVVYLIKTFLVDS